MLSERGAGVVLSNSMLSWLRNVGSLPSPSRLIKLRHWVLFHPQWHAHISYSDTSPVSDSTLNHRKAPTISYTKSWTFFLASLYCGGRLKTVLWLALLPNSASSSGHPKAIFRPGRKICYLGEYGYIVVVPSGAPSIFNIEIGSAPRSLSLVQTHTGPCLLR
jgi:hypothetical protein